MFGGNYYSNAHDDIPFGMRPPGQARRPNRRFDEYFRVYPVVMLPGPERKELNYGGKIIMPPSALEKLTRLHISYPMLFELRNGAKGKTTHAGVLEFIAEEGRVYMPYWMMQTLSLEPGDLLQTLSTDLPPGTFLKLQPQSMTFITTISDPKAVLENVLRNFAALTVGDIFQFHYNEAVYEIAVLEVKPDNASHHAITTLETDISVDFAPPLDYVEPERSTPVSAGSSRPGSVVDGGRGRVTPLGQIREGSMAKSIGYSNLAPTAIANNAIKSAFTGAGQKLRSSSKAGTPTAKPSTPVAGTSSNAPPVSGSTAATAQLQRRNNGNGPQPLRLPHGQLFFGFEIKPVKAKDGSADGDAEQKVSMFGGAGQTLRGDKGKKRKGDAGTVKPKKGTPEVIEID